MQYKSNVYNENAFSIHFAAATLIIFLSFWSILYIDSIMNMDIGWLLQCLERFIAGGTYTNDFYETNPPLSFLIYLPAYPLYMYWGWDAHNAVFLVAASYILFSNTITIALLSTLNVTKQNLVIIVCALAIAQTWGTGLAFAQRDNFIITFLIPLFLTQYLITTNKKASNLVTALSIILGGLAICLKPHYGVMSALLFAHRLYVRKSLTKAIISPDFLGLLVIGASYMCFILFITPDFVHVILPEVTSLYSIDKPYPLSTRLYYLGYGLCALFFSQLLDHKTKDDKQLKDMVVILFITSVLLTIPYLLQNKGFHYHALPLLITGLVALFIMLYRFSMEILQKPNLSIVISCCIISVLTYSTLLGKSDSPYLTKAQFAKTPLIETLKSEAKNNKYAVYDFKNATTSVPYISGLTNTSRFGQLWPLYNLTLLIASSETEKKTAMYTEKILVEVIKIAQDIQHKKPDALAFPLYFNSDQNKKTTDFLDMLKKEKTFKIAFENYQYSKTIDYNSCLVDNDEDPACITTYDIYTYNYENEKLRAP